MEPNVHKVKIPDSAYTSSTHRSTGTRSRSSKSRISNSSGSSGYGGHTSPTLDNIPLSENVGDASTGEKPNLVADVIDSTSASNNNPLITTNSINKHKKKKFTTSFIASQQNTFVSGAQITPATSPLPCVNHNCSESPVTFNPENQTTFLAPSMHDESYEQLLQKSPEHSTTLKISGQTENSSSTIMDGIEQGTNSSLNAETLPKIPSDLPSSQQELNSEQSQQKSNTPMNQFILILSLTDGVIMYATESLHKVLGFPKDMLLGRSFIDFVNPKDKSTLTEHIAQGVANQVSSFYCSLRQYKGLKTAGFAITRAKTTYLPFHLTMKCAEINSTSCTSRVYIAINAVLISSAYLKSTEGLNLSNGKNGTFNTRHSATCQLLHVDRACVSYLGYLPHHLLGQSVLELYHPEDMHELKDVYQAVMKEPGGRVVRSKPYRLRVQNGGYIHLDTEWTSFFNPWTQHLEFITGKHRVIKGPTDPDVFKDISEENQIPLPIEVIKRSKLFAQEILSILREIKQVKPLEVSRLEVSQRCKDLAMFMETAHNLTINCSSKASLEPFVSFGNQPGTSAVVVGGLNIGSVSPGVFEPKHSLSERNSVVLGDISPHHDSHLLAREEIFGVGTNTGEDSKSGSDTPPSYNQLNYNDNIQRFFESEPKTTLSDESNGENKLEANRSSTDEENKSSCINLCQNRKNCSPVHDSGSAGSGQSSGMDGGEAPSEAVLPSSDNNLNRNVSNCSTVAAAAAVNAAAAAAAAAAAVAASAPSSVILSRPSHSGFRNGLVAASGSSRNVTVRSRLGGFGDTIYRQPQLTEALLYRHNEDMERIMVQKHREKRHKGASAAAAAAIAAAAAAAAAASAVVQTGTNKSQGDKHKVSGFGLKRSGSHSWKNESINPIKHCCHSKQALQSAKRCALKSQGPTGVNLAQSPNSAPYQTASTSAATPRPFPAANPVNLWPPFSAMTPMHHTQPCSTIGGYPTHNQIPIPDAFPFYYGTHYPIMMAPRSAAYSGALYPPTPTAPTPSNGPNPTMFYPMMHPNVPLMHSSTTPIHYPFVNNSFINQKLTSQHPTTVLEKSTLDSPNIEASAQRSASRATSIKVEPGSIGGASLNQGVSGKDRFPSPLDFSSPLEERRSPQFPESVKVSAYTDTTGDESSYSSFYSILRTDKSDNSGAEDFNSNPKPPRPILKDPSWVEDVDVTSDLIFRYQLNERPLQEVLQKDLKELQNIQQPSLVNEQLAQLYIDMETENDLPSPTLKLEEAHTSSSSGGSGCEESSLPPCPTIKNKKRRKALEYGKLVMIFEEDAPMPPATLTRNQ